MLALLTLFTIIGITFVYLSDSYALSARSSRDAQNLWLADVAPEPAFAFIMGQLLYDVSDTDGVGIYSSLRGHSLARNMYGWSNDSTLPNHVPYSGVGRLRLQSPYPPQTEQDLINYRYFAVDGLLRDPERLGNRTGPGDKLGPYACCAVPYTYPDNNNVFLALLDPTTGQVSVPSFHRPWLFGALNDPNNPNWKNPVGKYLTCRVHPLENPNFGIPTDPGGDVKNLDGVPGGNDSIWSDPGGPILTAPNGQRYKMLVAPLLLELDSRLNLNVHGNVLASANGQPALAGNQGWGPWEVSLADIFPPTLPGNNEWQNLFLGSPATGLSRVQGRYGSGRVPVAPGWTAPSLPTPRGWGQTDWNGLNEPGQPGAGLPTGPYSLPGNPQNPVNALGLSPFPYFPPAGYGNGSSAEFISHPMQYNPLAPPPGNRLLPLLDTAALLRHGGTNSEFLSCDLMRLCPTAFTSDANSAWLRRMVTTASFDLDRVAPMPYVWDRVATPYVLEPGYPPSVYQPAMLVDPFTSNTTQALAQKLSNFPARSEFDPRSLRSTLGWLTRVNLDRPLTPYPAADPTTGLINPTNPTLKQALTDRQGLAQDLFTALQQATGALAPDDPLTPPPDGGGSPGQWNGLRYLAQLAVNIVDFMDPDSYSTPFQWAPTVAPNEWVYGVELPRLVLNEIYAQYDNDPADPGFAAAAANPKATTQYFINFWLELLNPFNRNLDAGQDLLAQLTTGSSSIYQVVLADKNLVVRGNNLTAVLQDPANATGDPDFGWMQGDPRRARSTVVDFGVNPAVVEPQEPPNDAPDNLYYRDDTRTNKGFFVVGRRATTWARTTPACRPRPTPPRLN